MNLTIKKMCGASYYLLVPHEYMKVFKLSDHSYNLEVSNDGETLSYTRISNEE